MKYSYSPNIKIFISTLIAVFIISAIRYNVSLPKLISPLPTKIDVLSPLRPKLFKKPNAFRIKHPSLPIVAQTFAAGDVDQAFSYIVIDFDSGDLISQKAFSQRHAVASLAKLMTAVVALDLASPQDQFMVSKKATEAIPTKILLLEGERLTLSELLHAVLMTSANDATQVIKDGIDKKYGEGAFVAAMNEKARIIGLKNSHFQNPQGFDDVQGYSSAEDITLLSEYALTQYPLIADIVKKTHVILPSNQYHREYSFLYNWNGLLDVYEGAQGVKIGNTDDALYTTSVVAKRGNKKLLTVILGAPSLLQRDLWAAELLNAGFKQLEGLAEVEVTEQMLRAKYSTWRYDST